MCSIYLFIINTRQDQLMLYAGCVNFLVIFNKIIINKLTINILMAR